MAQPQQRYRVIERIAAGGMAEVYRAESAGLEGFKKIVAIKRVLPHLAEKRQFIGMFLDEARTSAHLSHSNCVQVFDIGVGDNTYFIVMEFVDGADLKTIIEHRRAIGQRLPVEVACHVCVKVCEGLHYAHEATDHKGRRLGIVHRDMSPPNVLITRHGEVKIADFGLARANSQLERSEPGIIKGKFSYLSPEAALGEAVDHRTDIFAIGIMLWEMLAGRRLFIGDTDIDTVRQVQAAKVPSLGAENPEVNAELEGILRRVLARDPRERYQTARDLGRDLTAFLYHRGRPVSAFDVATLVDDAVRARDQDRQKRRRDEKVSIIGSLIDQAMLEFTSLDKEGTSVVAPRSTGDGAGSPLELGSFGGMKDWSQDLGASPSSDRSSALPAESYEAGNLAALEDDEEGAAPVPPGPVSARVEAAPAPPAAAPAPAKSGGSGGLVAIVVAVLLAAGAAGAWWSGLLR